VRKQVPEDLYEFIHLVDTPHLPWLAGSLDAGARVGVDPRLHPYRWYQDAEKTLGEAGIELVRTADNVVDACWDDRLYDFRTRGEHFREPSFDTISATAVNAAMCNYNHLNTDEITRLEEQDADWLQHATRPL